MQSVSQGRSGRAGGGTPAVSVALLGAVAIALVIGGVAYYRIEREGLGRDRYEGLHAVAELKAAEIARWREHRLFDAEALAASPFFGRAVAELLRGTGDARLAAELRERLRLETRQGTYEDALLLRRDGTVLASARPAPDAASAETTAALAVAMEGNAPALSGVYRCANGVVHIDAIAPMPGADGRPSVAVILRSDLETFLFPLVQSWPTPSASAETLLVRRDGEDVVFLNQLRHRGKKAPALRYPVAATDLPAARCVLGGRGRFEGHDYRGVEVIADLHVIPGSDWCMVAKIDEREIFAEVRYRGAVATVIMALGLLIVVATGLVLHRGRRARVLAELHAAERARREAVEELRTAFYSIGDAVITTDGAGTIRNMNGVAEELTGWREAEARGRTTGEVFRIVNEESRAAVEDPVARVLREGRVVGLANHTLLVARDGSERPIADSGAPIRDDSGAIAGVVLVFRDQTEERAARKELVAALERQRAILAAIPDVVMEVNTERVYTWANGAGLEFFGDDVLGREAAHYFEGEQDTYAQVQPLFAGREETFYVESWQRRRDGARRLLAWWCHVLKDAGGAVTGALSTARDITEQRAAETALRESEARFRGVFTEATIGKSLTSPEGRLLRVNRAFAEMLGRSVEEMQQLDFVAITHPDDLEDSRTCVRTLLAGRQGAYRMEKRYRHRDGSWIWTEVSTTLLRDELGAPLYFITSIIDIGVRKRAEAALAASEEKFSMAFRTSPFATTITRLADGRFLDVNDAFSEIIGFSREEAIADSSIGLRLWADEEDRRRVVTALLAGEPVTGREIVFRRRSGELMTDLFSAQLLEITGERCILSSIGDITERKLLAERETVRLRLLEFATTHTLEELLRATLDEVERITDSRVGFYHFVEADQRTLTLQAWSTRTIAEYCRAEGAGSHYDLDEAGVWCDCVRERRPIIHNDYAALGHRRGLPPGHAPLVRELVVPVFREQRIVAVFGVGNKETDYTENDLATVALLADQAWSVVERKRAQEALREAEDRYRQLFSAMREGVALHRLIRDGAGRAVDYVVEDVNPAFEAITGIPREAARGRGARALYGTGEPPFLDVYARVVESGEAVRFETRFEPMRKDLSISALAIGAERFATVFEDVTEHRAIERALRESEEKYRILVENAVEAIFVAQDGNLRYANSNAARMLGLPREQLIGEPFAQFIHPEDRELVLTRHRQRLRGEEPPARYSFRVVGGSAEPIWVELNTVVVEWEGAPATLNFANDVTERRLAEKRRAELEAQLRASQKMEAIGALAGGIAHDFNNLLSIILSCTDFAIAEAGTRETLRDELCEVRRAAVRAAELTKQLLAFGRKQILKPAPLDLNRAVVEMERLLRRILGEDILVERFLAAGLWMVKADVSQIEQVVMNLAINARDAMPGGGKLTIETANAELDEGYAAQHPGVAPGDYVMMSFTDTGAGMDSATRERIFEPFFTTKEKGKGTGLGLSTVYGIVKQSGGEVWVYSEPGLGTTFKVYLPRTAEAPAGPSSSRPPFAPTAGGGTVLVVEDEEAVRKLTVRILEAAGYAVIAAANGAEALAIGTAHRGEIRLLLTDVVMPGMSGRVLAERFVATLPGIRVLFMSGYTDNAIVHHGVLDQGTWFIQKPFTAAELTRKVREVLDL